MADFENIKKVFGRTDYNLRIALAETLRQKGENLFPKTQYCDSTKPAESGLHNMTCYICQSDQNAKLQSLSVAKLESVKKDVLLCDKNFPACVGSTRTSKAK